jgi:hypothetical protein
LKVIFDNSLKTNSLPIDWKTGIVRAIYKKGTKTEMGNYRPVNPMSILCKIIESLIRDHNE